MSGTDPADALRLRRYGPRDAAATAALMHRAVQEGASARYTAEERDAWSPGPPDPDAFHPRLASAWTVLAETAEGRLVGFMALTDDGVVDLAFVEPEWQGRGAAGRLYDAILAEARVRGLRRLTTEASHLARPFFTRRGWRLVAEQRIERRGVALTNFRMVLALG